MSSWKHCFSTPFMMLFLAKRLMAAAYVLLFQHFKPPLGKVKQLQKLQVEAAQARFGPFLSSKDSTKPACFKGFACRPTVAIWRHITDVLKSFWDNMTKPNIRKSICLAKLPALGVLILATKVHPIKANHREFEAKKREAMGRDKIWWFRWSESVSKIPSMNSCDMKGVLFASPTWMRYYTVTDHFWFWVVLTSSTPSCAEGNQNINQKHIQKVRSNEKDFFCPPNQRKTTIQNSIPAGFLILSLVARPLPWGSWTKPRPTSRGGETFQWNENETTWTFSRNSSKIHENHQKWADTPHKTLEFLSLLAIFQELEFKERNQ